MIVCFCTNHTLFFEFTYIFQLKFQLGGDIYREFYQSLESYLEGFQNSNCGAVKDIFLKNIRKYMDLDFDDN